MNSRNIIVQEKKKLDIKEIKVGEASTKKYNFLFSWKKEESDSSN